MRYDRYISKNQIRRNTKRIQSNSRTCSSKVQYSTRYEATKAMESVTTKRSLSGMNVYKCAECKQFHMGHNQPRVLSILDSLQNEKEWK